MDFSPDFTLWDYSHKPYIEAICDSQLSISSALKTPQISCCEMIELFKRGYTRSLKRSQKGSLEENTYQVILNELEHLSNKYRC